MPGTPTTKFAIPTLAGTTLARDIDTETNAALTAIDSKMVGYSEGPIGSRPTSTVGTPGIAGRIYKTTDSGPTNPADIYYIDHGTGWDRLARVVAVLTATWDPASIANGAATTTSVAVTGAFSTDVAVASFPGRIAGTIMDAQVSALGTSVVVTLANFTGSVYDAASGTLTVVVFRP